MFPIFASIICGNDYLASFAQGLNSSITVIPTVVDTDVYIPRLRRPTGPVRIGWTGSKSTRIQHLPLLKAIIIELAQKIELEFVIVADQDPQLNWPDVNIHFIRWSPENELFGLHYMDIGLMPLTDTPYERGKCGLKAITYMAVGIPAVVSPVGANRTIVTHGVTGLHCNTHEEWVNGIYMLAVDQHIRNEIGVSARKHVEENYSAAAILPSLLAIIEYTITLSSNHIGSNGVMLK